MDLCTCIYVYKWLWIYVHVFMYTGGYECMYMYLCIQVVMDLYVHVFMYTGGCGSMYEIHIDSELFKEKRLIQQHRLVNEVS